MASLPIVGYRVFADLSSGNRVLMNQYQGEPSALSYALQYAKQVRDAGPKALHLNESGVVVFGSHVCAVGIETRYDHSRAPLGVTPAPSWTYL